MSFAQMVKYDMIAGGVVNSSEAALKYLQGDLQALGRPDLARLAELLVYLAQVEITRPEAFWSGDSIPERRKRHEIELQAAKSEVILTMARQLPEVEPLGFLFTKG